MAESEDSVFCLKAPQRVEEDFNNQVQKMTHSVDISLFPSSSCGLTYKAVMVTVTEVTHGLSNRDFVFTKTDLAKATADCPVCQQARQH